MKRIVVVLALLLAGLAAYIYFFEPDTWARLVGGAPMTGEPPAPTTDASPAKERDTAPGASPTSASSASPPASIALPQDGQAWYVNGAAHEPGALVEAPQGEAVVAAYRDGLYTLESIQVESGQTYQPEWRGLRAAPTAGWDSFQGGGARTGFTASRDRADLQRRWTIDLGDRVRSSPIIKGQAVFFSSENHLLVAVDLRSGTVLWRQGEIGSTASPVTTDQFIFAGGDTGEFGGYRIKDGKRRGFTSLGSYPASMALIADDAFLVITGDATAYSIKTKRSFSGRLPLRVNWETSLPQLGATTATPAIADGKAFLQTESAGLLALSLETGRVLWPAAEAPAARDTQAQMTLSLTDDRSFLTPTPAFGDGVVYAAYDGALHAARAEDGAAIWRRPLDRSPSSSISLAYGALFLGDADGYISAYAAASGAPIFTTKISDKPIFASPAIFNDKLLIATGEGRLMLLSCFSGDKLAEDGSLAGASIDGSPAVSEAGIVAINRAGKIAAYE